MGGPHAWNVVKYDNEWHVLDATFGAGGLNADYKFKYNFNSNFFFCDIPLFNYTHFPRKEEWQLTDTKIDKETYKKLPYIGPAGMAHSIDLIHKEKLLEYKRGESLEILFTSENKIEDISCRTKSGKKVICTIVNEESNYKLAIKPSSVKSGYLMVFSGRELLFQYKILIK